MNFFAAKANLFFFTIFWPPLQFYILQINIISISSVTKKTTAACQGPSNQLGKCFKIISNKCMQSNSLINITSFQIQRKQDFLPNEFCFSPKGQWNSLSIPAFLCTLESIYLNLEYTHWLRNHSSLAVENSEDSQITIILLQMSNLSPSVPFNSKHPKWKSRWNGPGYHGWTRYYIGFNATEHFKWTTPLFICNIMLREKALACEI